MTDLLRALHRRHDGVRRPSRRAFRPGGEPLEPRELLSTGDVLTYHNDNARTGQDLTETVLNPALVNPGTFGKLFSYQVDGSIFGQPLYESGVRIGGVVHDVVFVATTHDSVYAFDADSNLGPNALPLWHASFINPAAGVTTASPADLGTRLFPELGILSTPVIDQSTGTIYVVAMTKEPTASGLALVQRLHALDTSTGLEKLGGPVVIQASVPGTGEGSQNGMMTFNARKQLQRSGLLLDNGVVYIAWASFDDSPPYQGWLMGYSASTLQRVSAFNVAPNGAEGSIWMSGGAPAADALGNIYLSTSNGTFDANRHGADFGDSILRLVPTVAGLTVGDYFAPSDQATLAVEDQDLGSGGVVLLPGQAGPVPLLVTAGKEGTIYLLNRANLGGYSPVADRVVHESPANAIGTVNAISNLWLGAFSTPAYFNNAVYYAGVGDHLKAFPVANGQMSDVPASQSMNTFSYPGASPVISADGTVNGIVWALEKGNPSVLHAYDAANLSHELYNSQMAGARDQLGQGVTFASPTVAVGKVFVGTQGQLTVFGDFNAAYVGGERSLLAQGLSTRAVMLLLSASPASVWHPATPALTGLLDREAQGHPVAHVASRQAPAPHPHRPKPVPLHRRRGR